MVHAYTPRAVRQAIKTGIKCIEHGQLLDEPTAKLMAEKGVWWSMQPFLDDRPSAFPEGSPKRIKQLQMYGGTDTAYALAKKFNIKTAWGAAVIPPMSSIIMTAMLGLSAARAPAAASATTTASAAFARRPRPTFSIALRSIRFILCSPLDALARTGWAARWIFGRPRKRMGRRP